MLKKYFTPEEANLRLPLVRRIVADILTKGKRFKAISHIESSQEKDTLILEIENHIRELEELGCHFKDWNFEIGLVDFPSLIDGREAMLCWRSDEPEVEWYHDLTDGYAGRKPLSETAK